MRSGGGADAVRRDPTAVLLEELRLVGAGHLGGQVDVAREVAVARDRVRRPLTESSNTGASNCFDVGVLPPVASATAQSMASRALSLPVATVNSLKSGFVAFWACQKQDSTLPSEVTRAGMDRLLFVERRQRADERRAEVGDDDVDLRVLGDRGGQDLLGQRGVPVRRLERLLADEGVLAGRVEDRVQRLALVDALAVAGGAGEEQDVAAVGQVLEDPVAPSSCRRW